jgi:hypothetical protein
MLLFCLPRIIAAGTTALRANGPERALVSTLFSILDEMRKKIFPDEPAGRPDIFVGEADKIVGFLSPGNTDFIIYLWFMIWHGICF